MTPKSQCPFCHKDISVPAALAGRQVKCLHCNGEFTAPMEASAPAIVDTRLQRIIRFTFTCLRCGSALEAGSDMCDALGRCPTCGAVFTVPRVDRHTGLPVGPAVVADDGELPTPMHAYAAAGEKAPRIVRLPSGEQVIICPQCDVQLPVDSNICPRCGRPFTMESAAAIAMTAHSPGGGLATASFVLGLLSIPTFCFPLLGLVAAVLGSIALTRRTPGGHTGPGRRLAIAGVTCGLASMGLGLLHILKKI